MSRLRERHVFVPICICALLLLGVHTARAQGRAEGSIAGTAVDETKAVLPGVTISATNMATGLSRVSVTDANGKFRLAALPPGAYQISATLEGFTPVKKSVTVTVGSESTVDVSMAVGSLAVSVTVSAAGQLVEAARTEQSATFSAIEIQNLPTNSRNFLDFALLSPGVVRGRTSGAGFGSEGGVSSSGNRGDQNAINIDGVVNKSLDNGLDQENFSQEGVQEFQIITQGYPAEFGGSAGAVINAVTKSGTNKLGGYGYYFLRNNRFDQAPFDLVTQADGTKVAKSAADANEFSRQIGGLVVGGPIVKNKMFYFALAERTVSNTPRVRTIGAATLTAVRKVIPGLTDDDSNRVTQFKPDGIRTSVKLDSNWSTRHTASLRFAYTKRHTPAGTAAGLASVMNASDQNYRNYSSGFSLNSMFSSSRLNTLRAQIYSDDTKQDWPQLGGFGNQQNFPPQIIIGGSAGGTFGRQNAGGFPHTWEQKYELQDTFSLYKGKHSIKAGGQYVYVRFYQINDYGPDGQWRFSDLNAFNAGKPSGFLQTWGVAGVYMPINYISLFAQDEWQPRENITVNIGVRYQVDKFPSNIASYDLPEPAYNPTTLEFTTKAGSPNMGGYKTDWNNVMPRIGVTWSPDKNRTVFRAAAGTFYGNNYIGEMANGMGWDGAPSSQRYTFTSTEATAIWNGVANPASPYYNPLGYRRLPNSYINVLKTVPFTRVPFASDITSPWSAQANVGIEHQIGSSFSVAATYLWSRGYENVRSVNTNPAAAVAYAQGARLPNNQIAPFNLNYRQGPRADARFGEVLTYMNAGKMGFKGVTLSGTGRWSHLTAKASFTWNDVWDDSVSISFTAGPSDLECGTRCEWSRSVLNVKRFVGSLVYSTPTQWNVFLRDFQLAGTFEAESGHPFQVVSGFDFNNDTQATDRPVGVPRNALMTDAFYNVDLRVSRAIPIHGTAKLEIMLEVFNLLNTPHYDNYDGNLYVFQGGVYVPRADFAAFAAGGKVNEQSFDRSAKEIGLNPALRRTGVGQPMQGQLGLRFRF